MLGESPPAEQNTETDSLRAGDAGNGALDTSPVGSRRIASRARLLARALPVATVGALIVVLAMRARLAAHFPYLWFDEALNALPPIEARTFAELQGMAAHQFQPFLDYWLRWAVWIPLLGTDEWAQRIPALLHSLASVILAGAVCHGYLLRRGHGQAYAWVGAAVAALFLANHPLEVEIGTEVRHYALVTLLSVLWAGLAVLPERPRPVLAALASLLFVNVHFFALPPVIMVSVVLAVQQAQSGRWRTALGTLGALAGVVALCVLMNRPALHAIITSPNGARALDFSAANLARVLGEARFIYERLLLQLDDGGVAVLAWGAVSALTMLRTADRGQRAAWLRIAAVLVVVLPVFLIMSRLRTEYPFSPRYGTPYVGLGFALVVVGLDALPTALRPPKRWLSARWLTALSALPIIVLAIQVAIPLFGLASRPGTLEFDSTSAMRETFDSLKALGRPALVAASPCWAEMVPRYYWKYAGTPPPAVGFEVTQPSGARSCLSGAMDEDHRGLFDDFLGRHPDGLILLFQQHAPCPIPPAKIQRRRAAIAAHQEWHPVVRGGNDLNACLWIIADAADEEEVRDIARQAGFPPAINLAR
jgi:hypothetical protein